MATYNAVASSFDIAGRPAMPGVRVITQADKAPRKLIANAGNADQVPYADLKGGLNDAPPAKATKLAPPKKATKKGGKPAKGGKATKTTKPAKTKKTGDAKVGCLTHAYNLLSQDKHPDGMTTKEIIENLAAAGTWVSPGGKTPEATLYAAILREINTKGNAARFTKVSPGHFTAS